MNGPFTVRIAAVAFACLGLAACAWGVGHPEGWTAASANSWTKDGQTYSVATQAFDGTITDLANQETVDMLLRAKGAKFVRSDPYPDCPGLGALMTFGQTTAQGSFALLEAFVIRDSTATLITYKRPAAQAQDPAAMAAMRSAICHI